MNSILSFFRGVRRALGSLLMWLLGSILIPLGVMKPKRLLTRQEKRAMARRMANVNVRRYVNSLSVNERWEWRSRKRRRSLARGLAKFYFYQLRGATV